MGKTVYIVSVPEDDQDRIFQAVNDLVAGVYESGPTVQMADTLVVPIAEWRSFSDETIRRIQRENVYTMMTGQALTIEVTNGDDRVRIPEWLDS